MNEQNIPLPPLLEVKDLRVSFGGKEVVHGVDFTIAPGEKLALVGESGSGKTVTALSLVRLLHNARVGGSARLAPAQPGQAPLELLQASERELLGVRGRDIAMIFQEPMTALNPVYTVGDQIAEVLQIKQALSARQAWDAAVEALAATGIPEPARGGASYPHLLSGGQRQRAMLAMALACRPRLLLADLQRQTGMAVLLITHDLNLVRRFADRVAVMEDGHLVEHGPVGTVFAQPQHPYTRKLIESRPARDVQPPRDEPPVVQAEHLRVIYPVPIPGFKGWFRKGEFVAVEGARFQVPSGGTLGVVGESGSGKSTLALAALGLIPHRGELQVVGQRWGTDTVRNRGMRRLVQVVFQDPFSSLSPRMTVEEIVGEGLLVHESALSLEERRERVYATLEEVGLTEAQFPGLLGRYPHEFSGGQRQRLAIARALIVQPQVLVLDEPTSALDVTIQKQVLKLLQRLQRERGLSYLLITHDVDVIRAMAHEVLVMKDGRVVESGSVDEVLERPRETYTQTLVAAAS